MVLWLSDNGSLCFVKRSSVVKFNVQRGVCTSSTMNFSLLEHLNKLYIVNSGGFLPFEAPGIYEIIPGVPPMVIQQTRLYGKDVFVVHKQGGFMLESSKDDCRIFTGSMLPDVDCAMFSYKNSDAIVAEAWQSLPMTLTEDTQGRLIDWIQLDICFPNARMDMEVRDKMSS